MEVYMGQLPMLQNDASVLGLLLVILTLIFVSAKSSHPFFKKFYTYCPSLLLCYFVPSLFASMGVISGDQSSLYFVALYYSKEHGRNKFTVYHSNMKHPKRKKKAA